jgi:hypothetical protein
MKAIPNLVLRTHRAPLVVVGGLIALALGACGSGAGADPYSGSSPITLTVTPSAQSVAVNTAVTISATAEPAGQVLYFQWVQVAGQTLSPDILGGTETPTLGFTPTVPGTYKFQVCVSRENNLNGSCANGIYSVTAVVTATGT